MKLIRLIVFLLVATTLAPEAGQVTAQTPEIFKATLDGVIATHEGMEVSLLGEHCEVNGSLVLDANNGFFDHGSFVALGQHPPPADEKPLISSHFTDLSARSNSGIARWHLWTPKPGPVQIRIQMEAPNSQHETQWMVDFSGQSRLTTTGQCADDTATRLSFNVSKPGLQTLRLQLRGGPLPTKTKIQQIRIRGPGITDAQLLRARWRPSAIHTQYSSSTCAQTKLWVFETESLTRSTHYSPMTTRFGYFGASFDADGRAAGNVNFSMWAANRNAKSSPPISQMPHLLATGNPDAEFSGFGHEGSGVKIRNWQPYLHHPKSVIQALRLDAGSQWNTYSGYLFDQRTERWVLFATGRKPVDQTKRSKIEFLRPASFCEIPGPPAQQRTGDQRRTVRRRGWFLGNDKRWHAVDRQTTKSPETPTNRSIASENGWLTMSTGGMKMVVTPEVVSLTNSKPSDLPIYLQPHVANQLMTGPVTFDTSYVSDTTKTTATVTYDFVDSGPNAEATLHYGTTDCLTFVDRVLHGTEKKSAVNQQMLSSNRTWSHRTTKQPVIDNHCQFNLSNLQPDTEYHYRIHVKNDNGKSWAFETGMLQTN